MKTEIVETLRERERELHFSKIRNKKGITLIALVITIIILLILAGITISSLTGENGLISKVQKVKEESENAETYQNEIINEYEEEIEKYINGEKYKVASYRIIGYNQANGKLKLSVKIGDNEEIEYEVIDGEENIYIVDENGQQEKYIIQTKGFTKNDRSTIENGKDLEELSIIVNMGNTLENKTIEVTKDIDLKNICYEVDGTETNDKSWVPIGTETNTFQGTFEGNNHKIENLYIDSRGKTNQALFSINNGKIQNLEITGEVTGNEVSVALICGANYGKIKNITTNGTVGGWNQTGGCAGVNYGTIELCVNRARVYPLGTTGNYGKFFGGIVGVSNGNVEKCTNYGEISGNHGVGGIVGDALIGEINLCTNKGTIVGISNNQTIYIGGISGTSAYNNKHTIRNCVNIGEVKSNLSGSNCGGIVGYIAGSKSRICYY